MSEPVLPEPEGIRTVPALSVRPAGTAPITRILAEETPVALVHDGTTHAVMMASPGDIRDLAIGFALTEGIITDPAQITRFDEVSQPQGIEARIWLRRDRGAAFARRRRAMVGPVGCGLCGIESLAEAMRPLPDLRATDPGLARADITAGLNDLRNWQPLHDRTRMVHGAAFLLPGRGIILSREDVGRHNALDKLVGALARRAIAPATGAIILTSRVSVEMVQKTAIAGAGLLVAPSGPTAHAARLADEAGLTLIGFARDCGFEVFTHPKRLNPEVNDVA